MILCIIGSTPNEIQSISMIDSGATSSFISSDFVQQFQIPTVPKPVSIRLKVIDSHALPLVTHKVRTLL